MLHKYHQSSLYKIMCPCDLHSKQQDSVCKYAPFAWLTKFSVMRLDGRVLCVIHNAMIGQILGALVTKILLRKRKGK
jgi:hypothetical protein